MNVLKKQAKVLYLIVTLLFLSQAISAIDGESLTYDAETGIYTIQYYNTYDQPTPVLQRARFELPTRIDPTIRAKVKETEKGVFVYRYSVKNGKLSKQHLVGVRLLASHAYETGQLIPSGWHGSTMPRAEISMFNIGWSYRLRNDTGLKPGQDERGFGFVSRDLPGIGMVETWGNEKDLGGFSDMGPSSHTPIGKQYLELSNNNETVPRPAALPRIVVPTPFDAAVVLSGIQKHLNQDLVSMKLVDPVFASQLDRLLQTAAQAAKQGNTQGLRSNIQDLRRLLKREHEHVDKEDTDKDDAWDDDKKDKPKPKLIDKLAAKVLDFDLKYVLKRVGEKS